MTIIEQRFTELMVCAIWVHLTHEMPWFCLAVPCVAFIWASLFPWSNATK